MKALLALSLALPFSLVSVNALGQEAEIQAELANYDELSRNLLHRVGKAERNAKNCYKNLPSGYQAMVQAKGVFPLFEESRVKLEENRVSVKGAFVEMHAKLGGKLVLTSVNAGSGGLDASAADLEQKGGAVAEAKARIAEMEAKLKKIKKDLASPSDRKNIEFLVDCGDKTAVPNVRQAMQDFDDLVASHERLSRYLTDQHAALTGGVKENRASARSFGSVAKK